jgi:predicted transcriptional regulator
MKRKSIEVLSFLIENSGEKININRISKNLKMDYKNTYNIVQDLAKQNLISLEKFGKSISCILNKKAHPLIFEAEEGRRKKLIGNKNFMILYEKLKLLPFSFISLVFGSYAKGESRKNSDIDMMILCEKNREKEIENTISMLPLKIHLVVLTYDEFLSMAKSREFSVVSEAIKNNIILIGIEDYYRMIENAK